MGEQTPLNKSQKRHRKEARKETRREKKKQKMGDRMARKKEAKNKHEDNWKKRDIERPTLEQGSCPSQRVLEARLFREHVSAQVRYNRGQSTLS